MKIHPTAIVHPKAKLADDVKVGPYTVIEENVAIGAGTEVGAFCVIEGWTTIGNSCCIFTGAVVGSIPQDLKYKGSRSFLKIGNNNIIREYVTINPGTTEGSFTTIGDGNELMAYSHIAHDCILGNNIIVANGGTLAGYVVIEDRVIIGGLVAIHQFVRIGKLAIVGGCSKAVQDILPFCLADGHPARIYGINSVGLKRSGIEQKARSELKRVFKILMNGQLSIPHAIKLIQEEINPPSAEVGYLIKFIRESKRGLCR